MNTKLQKTKKTTISKNNKKNSFVRKNNTKRKQNKPKYSKENIYQLLKIQKGGTVPENVIQDYAQKIFDLLQPNGEFSTIFRGLFNLQYLNNFNNMYEELTPTIQEKTIQINLRLFCWIRDNVPGSVTVIKKGSIFSRTLSRDNFNQLNIYMINPKNNNTMLKPGIFANTSILANGTVNVSTPIDSVIFLKTTRDIIYLNIIPFLHLFGTGWKDRVDISYPIYGLAAYLNVDQVFGSTHEWSISKPLQAMEMDGIICTDPVESLYSEKILSWEDKLLIPNKNMKPGEVNQHCGKIYEDFCETAVVQNTNQVFLGQQIDGGIPQSLNQKKVYWFPEFLSFVYKEDTFLKMISLEEEYNSWERAQDTNWPNNINLLPEVKRDRDALESYRLNFNNSREYYRDIWKWADKKFVKKTPDGGPDRTDDEIAEKLGINHSRLRRNFGKDSQQVEDSDEPYPFIIYDLSIYNDEKFQKFGVNMTNISDVQFSQIKPNDYFKLGVGTGTETQKATESLIDKLLRKSIANPYTKEDYNKVVVQDPDPSSWYEPRLKLDYQVYIGPLYGGNNFEKNINLLNLLDGQLCNNVISAMGPLNKEREVCDVKAIPVCDADHYPGGFMDIKETATNNFYYDESNNEFVAGLTKQLLDHIIRDKTGEKNPYQNSLKKQIISVIINNIDLSQFMLYYFYKNKLAQITDTNMRKKINKIIKSYNDGGLYKYVKGKILNYDIVNSIIAENDERNLVFTTAILAKELFDVIIEYTSNSRLCKQQSIFDENRMKEKQRRAFNNTYGKNEVYKISDFPDYFLRRDAQDLTVDSVDAKDMIEEYFLGRPIKDKDGNLVGRQIFTNYTSTKEYTNRTHFIIDNFEKSANSHLFLTKNLKQAVEGPPEKLKDVIAQYIGEKLWHGVDETFGRNIHGEVNNLKQTVEEIITQFTNTTNDGSQVLDNRLKFLETINREDSRLIFNNSLILDALDFKEISESSRNFTSNLIPLFCNIYLKGGTAFRLLFNRELLLEKDRQIDGVKMPNRLEAWEPKYREGQTEEEARKAKKEAELKINKKLGEPSDYDLNCCINPWLGEHHYNKIKESLNIIISCYMKLVIYPEIAKRYGPNFESRDRQAQERRTAEGKNLAALLQSNPYNKPLYIVPELGESTLTSWREKVDESKITTLRNNIDNIIDINNYNYNAKNNHGLLPDSWQLRYPEFIEIMRNNEGLHQQNYDFKDKSFSFYSRSHMLWITEKMLDESTEFDLHRLMLQMPLKSVYINNEEKEKGAKQVGQITTDLIKLNDVSDIKYNLTDDEFNKYIEVNMNNQVKKVESKSIIAIELIDISVINWGGIEKFTKWHDATDLRSDTSFAVNDKVLFISKDTTMPDGWAQQPAVIKNVYSVSGYYDILLTDRNWTIPSPLSLTEIQERTQLRIKSFHDDDPDAPFIVPIDSLRKWSDNLQLCSFSHAIQDLSLVIDDNIRSGRTRKLLKRQRRRAFLSQVRYLFVETPDKKAFSDLKEGPINLLKIEGFENIYDLLDQPVVATSLIKTIFNTNIPSYEMNGIYPTISLLPLDDWNRTCILLITIIVSTYQVGNIPKFNTQLIVMSLAAQYLVENINMIMIMGRDTSDRDMQNAIIKYFLNMLTLMAENANKKSSGLTATMDTPNLLLITIYMLDDTYAILMFWNNMFSEANREHPGLADANTWLNTRYMNLRKSLALLIMKRDNYLNTTERKKQLALQTDMLSKLGEISLPDDVSNLDNPKIIFDKQTVTSLYNSIANDPFKVNLSTYTLYYSDFNKYNSMKKSLLESPARTIVGNLSDYFITELNSNNESITFNIMAHANSDKIPSDMEKEGELDLPEHTNIRYKYVPTIVPTNNDGLADPEVQRREWKEGKNDFFSGKSAEVAFKWIPHSSYNMMNETVDGTRIFPYTDIARNLARNNINISEEQEAATQKVINGVCNWLYNGAKNASYSWNLIPVSIVTISNSNKDTLIDWIENVNNIAKDHKTDPTNLFEMINNKYWEDVLDNWKINIDSKKGRLYIVDEYTNMKILRDAIFESSNVNDVLINARGYLNFENTNTSEDIEKIIQEKEAAEARQQEAEAHQQELERLSQMQQNTINEAARQMNDNDTTANQKIQYNADIISQYRTLVYQLAEKLVDIEEEGRRAIRPFHPGVQQIFSSFHHQQSQSYDNTQLSALITILLQQMEILDRKNYYFP